jgi:hypothetical protein
MRTMSSAIKIAAIAPPADSASLDQMEKRRFADLGKGIQILARAVGQAPEASPGPR